MRTTVTLDPDTESLLRRRMREGGVSFKQALNDAIRAGLTVAGTEPVAATRSRRMGRPAVDLDRALQVAGDLEDDELVRRLRDRA